MGMTVTEMVRKTLTAGGYDGLVNDECGCTLSDFAPCSFGVSANCMAAFVAPSQGLDYEMYENRQDAVDASVRFVESGPESPVDEHLIKALRDPSTERAVRVGLCKDDQMSEFLARTKEPIDG